MVFTLSHRQRVGDEPEFIFQKTSFSYGWHCNWLSEVAVGGNGVTIGHPGGRLGWYEFVPSSATLSERNYWDNSQVEKLFDQYSVLDGYRLHRPDGSQWDYQFEADNGEYHLTKQTTPEGDSIVFSYDSEDRLEYVQDASGNQTLLKYEHSNDPDLVTELDQRMNLGGVVQTVRSASFAYTELNMEWRLTAITDVAGITSTLSYDSNGWIDSMTTPYGTTQFAFTEISASPAFERSVLITEPEGLSSAYVLIDDDATGMPETFQTNQYPAVGEDLDATGPGTALFPSNTLDLPSGSPLVEETVRNHRNSFYWNPLQWVPVWVVG